MGDILFCAFYLLLFSFIIIKSPFFALPGLNKRYSAGSFYLKLLFGVVLWYIYTYHYKNRYSSDIFKYYDDSKLMFSAIHSHFSDFLKMLSGIGGTNPYIEQCYHSMASWMNDHDSNLYNNSHFLIRLNTLFLFFSFGHYGVHVILMCFISLCGLVYLYKSFYPFLQASPKLLFAAIFLFPSVLLWGSGILKEGLVLFALGLTIYYFQKFLQEKKITKSLFLLLVGVVLLFEIKAYVFLCILPGFIAEAIINRVELARKYTWVTYLIVLLVYMGVGLNIHYITGKTDPLKMLSDKQKDFLRTANGGIFLVPVSDNNRIAHIDVDDSVNIIPATRQADSLLHHAGIQYLTSSAFCYREEQTGNIVPFKLARGMNFVLIRSLLEDTIRQTGNDSTLYRLDTYIEPAKSMIMAPLFHPTLKGLVSYIPSALSVSMLRPLPDELTSGGVKIYFAENVIIILLIGLAIAFRKRKIEYPNIVAFCLSYCLLMLVLIGISTPLYGGIERYKSVVIPFMLILLLLIYDKDKFQRTLKN